jgi:cell wall-associated NlpC family hydrolase
MKLLASLPQRRAEYQESQAKLKDLRRSEALDLYKAGLLTQREFAKRMGVRNWKKFPNRIPTEADEPRKASSSLSQALGYLVDETGAPILNAKGKPIVLPKEPAKLDRFGSATAGYWAVDPNTGKIINLLPPQPKQYAPKGLQLKTLKNGATAVFDPNSGRTDVVLPPPKGGGTTRKLTPAQAAKFRSTAVQFAEDMLNGWTEDDGTRVPPRPLYQALEELKKQNIPWSLGKRIVIDYYKKNYVGPPSPADQPYYSGKGKPARGGRQNTAFAPGATNVIDAALTQIGKPYVFGSGPDTSSFDCSDLVQWAYKQIGIDIPRVTYDQWRVGRPVKWGQFQPGDLVFTNWNSKRKAPGHVMLYIGNNKMISAPYTGSTVKVVDVSGYRGSFVTARRLLPDAVSV